MNRLYGRRALIEWMLSFAALATVAAAIVGIDERTRAYVAAAAASPFSSAGGVHLPPAVSRMVHTAWDLCLDHQPLALFAIAAVILVLFMVRTR
jgi:hypothetical protein